MSRIDAKAKASGATRYVGDVSLPNLAYTALVRSTMPHARIISIDDSAAKACEGVVGVFTAKDVSPSTYGRFVLDVPILAKDKVRFVGERIAAVVATSRQAAEMAASMVEVSYEELPAVTTLDEALAPDAPLIHDKAWEYPNAHVTASDPPNTQGIPSVGSKENAEAGMAASAYVIDATYTTQAVHQGYLETQACVASYNPDGVSTLWCTSKAPHLLRSQLAACLGMEAEQIDVQPIALGGDFGGKGSPQESPICMELSRLTGRPIKIVLRYNEDLTSTNPRHPSRIRMRLGCDENGALQAAMSEAIVDGGAYLGFSPSENGTPTGFLAAPAYRIPAFYAQSRVVYTNKVPKGNMRAPGSPQFCFAFESAMDELAAKIGIDPVELRRRNLLHEGDATPLGKRWIEYRADEVLDAATENVLSAPAMNGWLIGTGFSLHSRGVGSKLPMSIRLIPTDDGGVTLEFPVVETGTGNHTAMLNLIATRLGLATDKVTIVQTSTGTHAKGLAVGGARVTTSLALSADIIGRAWAQRTNNDPMVIDIEQPANEPAIGSYTVQVAQVAVDPGTGQVKVLDILTAVDVGQIVNPMAHQAQIDGGTVMGYGFSCLEDLDESEGQVWGANLGEFKLASARDAPHLRTAIVDGGIGIGEANVKGIGESTTPPTAAAIANAIYDASGCRIRDLPITAERVYEALCEHDPRGASSASRDFDDAKQAREIDSTMESTSVS